MSDALATLQTALAPKTGMRRIPFPTESYQHPSPPLNAERLLNFYIEQQPAESRTQAALIPTSGLARITTVGAGPIWAMNDDQPGVIYLVSGTRAYRLGFPIGVMTIDDLGEVGAATGGGIVPEDQIFVSIAVSATAAVICVPPNAWTCGHASTDALVQLGGTFEGAASVAFMDGYFAFSDYSNNTRWFICGLMDPTNFDALDFAYSDALPNVTRRIIAHRGEFWMIGSAGHEVWYDTGDLDFPFRRRPGAVIPVGTISPRSVCRLDQSVWWVGPDNIVYRSVGYQFARVSTHAIEAIIAESGSGNAVALAYTVDGHAFYVLTVSGRTLAYDANTKQWHDRASSVDGTGTWRPSCCITVTQLRWFGDAVNGNLYSLVPGLPADNEVNVFRSATFPTIWAGTYRAFCSRLEIELESGTGAQLVLEWSDDGGRTWTGRRDTMITGNLAEWRHRVYTTRLGSFRQRTFRISMVASVPLYAVDADIAGGTA